MEGSSADAYARACTVKELACRAGVEGVRHESTIQVACFGEQEWPAAADINHAVSAFCPRPAGSSSQA